jgi:hypothetical protein
MREGCQELEQRVGLRNADLRLRISNSLLALSQIGNWQSEIGDRNYHLTEPSFDVSI